jgi:uncharacterized membrane protein YfcA
VLNFALYLVIGLAAGFLSGLLGIGGGVLMVPALALLMSFDQHVAHGTSLAVIVPGALAGTLVYHFRGSYVDWPVAACMAVGAVGGAYLLGAPLATKLDQETLKKLFGIVMIVMGLRMAGVFAFLTDKLTGLFSSQ